MKNLTIAALITTATLAVAFASAPAVAYDPCQRALQYKQIAKNELNDYYATHCTWTYDVDHCRNPALGHRLEDRYLARSAEARRECR